MREKTRRAGMYKSTEWSDCDQGDCGEALQELTEVSTDRTPDFDSVPDRRRHPAVYCGLSAEMKQPILGVPKMQLMTFVRGLLTFSSGLNLRAGRNVRDRTSRGAAANNVCAVQAL